MSNYIDKLVDDCVNMDALPNKCDNIYIDNSIHIHVYFDVYGKEYQNLIKCPISKQIIRMDEYAFLFVTRMKYLGLYMGE